MNIDYDEPVFKKDVANELEYIGVSWKVFFSIYYRLCQQGAPATLTQEVIEINSIYKQLYEKIGKVQQYFPEEETHG